MEWFPAQEPAARDHILVGIDRKRDVCNLTPIRTFRIRVEKVHVSDSVLFVVWDEGWISRGTIISSWTLYLDMADEAGAALVSRLPKVCPIGSVPH